MRGLYDKPPAPPEPPSFEPWLGRVRMARALVAIAGFTVTGAITWMGGMPLEDVALRSIVVSIVSYFVAWGAALWLFSELYFAQVRRMRDRLQAIEMRKAQQLEELYRQRLGGGESDAAATQSFDPNSFRERPAA